MFFFSLSLSSLPYLLNHHSDLFFLISSLCLIINRFDLIHMIHQTISSSSKSTCPFDLLSIETKSITCLNERNFNQNALDSDENLPNKKNNIHRLIQSSTDITTHSFHSSINRKMNTHKNKRATRIESALITSDYSHLLNHSLRNTSRHIIDINMNRTIDRIKRNDAGDQNSLSHSNKNQMPNLLRTDHNHYLTLEQIPIHNRSKIQLTSKQLLLISISVFLFVILLCLVMIFLIV